MKNFLPLILIIIISGISAKAQTCITTARWLGGTGSWYDSTKWSTGAVPGPGDCVQIDSGQVTTPFIYDREHPEDTIRIKSLTVNGGMLRSQSYYIISENLNWSNGVIIGGFEDAEDLYYGSSMIVQGSFNITGQPGYVMLLRNKRLFAGRGGIWQNPRTFTMRNADVNISGADSLYINTDTTFTFIGHDDNYSPFHPNINISTRFIKTGNADCIFATQRITISGNTELKAAGLILREGFNSALSAISNCTITAANNTRLVFEKTSSSFEYQFNNVTIISQGRVAITDQTDRNSGRITFYGGSITADTLICYSDKDISIPYWEDAMTIAPVVTTNYLSITKGPIYATDVTTGYYEQPNGVRFSIAGTLNANGTANIRGGILGGGGLASFNDSLVVNVPGNGVLKLDGINLLINGRSLFKNFNIALTNGTGFANEEFPLNNTFTVAAGKRMVAELSQNSSIYLGANYSDLVPSESTFYNNGIIDLRNTGGSLLSAAFAVPLFNNDRIISNAAVAVSLSSSSLHNRARIALDSGSRLQLAGGVQHVFDSARVNAPIIILSGATSLLANYHSRIVTDSLSSAGDVTIDTSALLRAGIINVTAGNFTSQPAVNSTKFYLSGGAINGTGAINVDGRFAWTGGNINAGNRLKVSGPLDLSARISSLTGRRVIMEGGGNWNRPIIVLRQNALFQNQGSGTLIISAPANDSAMLIAGDTSTLLFRNLARIIKTGAGKFRAAIDFINRDSLQISAGSVVAVEEYSNNIDGYVSGNGTLDISSALVHDNGQYAPGDTIGTLTLIGNYTGNKLSIQTGNGADLLVVSDTLRIKNTALNVQELSTPAGTDFVIALCQGRPGCRVGTFGDVTLPAGYSVSYTDTSVLLHREGMLLTGREKTTTPITELPTGKTKVMTVGNSVRIITPGNADLLIFGTNGAIIKSAKSKGSVIVDLGSLAHGIYIVRNLTTQESIRFVY